MNCGCEGAEVDMVDLFFRWCLVVVVIVKWQLSEYPVGGWIGFEWGSSVRIDGRFICAKRKENPRDI